MTFRGPSSTNISTEESRQTFQKDYVVPLGKARVAREGHHLSVITYAAMLAHRLEAAEILKQEGIEIEILDLRTVSPLYREVIATVKKTNKVIVLHEHARTGGLAGEISAIINEEAFEMTRWPLIVRLTSPDTPVPFSPPQEEFFLPKVSDLVREARRLRAY